MPGSIFELKAGRYIPTELARGPWDPSALHGGTVAGLLASHVERAVPGRLVARLTFEFLRPAPTSALTVAAEVIREGRSVSWVKGRVSTRDKDVAEVTAVALRRTRHDLPMLEGPATHRDGEAPPGPEFGSRAPDPPGADYPAFHNRGMEIRFVRGSLVSPGPALGWFRLAVPLIPGEVPSPLVRVATASDFSNGSSTVLSWHEFTFINPDLTIYLTRYPVGEWVCLDAVTQPGPDGTGVAESHLHDQTGPIGTTLQSVLFNPLPDRLSETRR